LCCVCALGARVGSCFAFFVGFKRVSPRLFRGPLGLSPVNLIFRQRFPGQVPLLQWRLPGLLLLYRLLYLLHLLLRGRLPALLLLLERLLFRVLLILMLQLLLRRYVVAYPLVALQQDEQGFQHTSPTHYPSWPSPRSHWSATRSRNQHTTFRPENAAEYQTSSPLTNTSQTGEHHRSDRSLLVRVDDFHRKASHRSGR
jgi:hypothetical protein